MAIRSGLFNSINGDRRYLASHFAEYFATFIGNGVFPNPSTGLQVIANNDMTVTIKAGKAWINGYYFVNDDNYVLNLDVADGVLKRIDRIVLRFENRDIVPIVKKGTFASSPTAPTLQRDADAYEITLADILINNGVTSISQSNITDQRLNKDLCGIVHGVVNQVDTTSLFNQYQSWLNEQKAYYEENIAQWTADEQADFELWRTQQENAFSSWMANEQTNFTSWMDSEKLEFDTWFQTIQNILDENTAGNLMNEISSLDNKIGILNEFKNKKVSDEEIHGLRATNGKLEFYNGIEWKTVSGGLPVGNVSNFQATEDDRQVTLKWQDPEDVVLSGSTLARWKSTRILRKTGSYPVNENDGIVVVNSGVRNQYKDNGFIDTGLTNDTTYYYSAFPYAEHDIFDVKSDVSATPTERKIYGVRIDKSNSNPETAVTYTDNAIGMTGGSSDWDNKFPFSLIKPCLLKNGVVQYYLNPNDFTKKANGTNADITSGNDGDVMIEFPKIYWKITSDTSQVLVKYSDKQVDSTYKPLAHTKGANEKDKVYVGAYLGNTISSKLRSLSGKSPTASQTIGTFRTQAQANGTNYQQMGYYQLLMLQILYLVRFKNLDSQTALGRGYVDGNSAVITTGGTNTKGMNFGEKSGKQQMKFCGIEDFYGNCYYWIDGLFCNSNRNILIGNQNFNDNGSGYSNFGQGATANLNGYINDVQGGSETGFIVKAASGSATTYYSDYGSLNAGYLPVFGAYLSDGSYGGAFQLHVSSSASSSSASISARPCYV